jgi:hypothetical protein
MLVIILGKHNDNLAVCSQQATDHIQKSDLVLPCVEAKVLTLFPKLLSESEKRHFSKYGKLPRGGLLGQKCKVH